MTKSYKDLLNKNAKDSLYTYLSKNGIGNENTLESARVDAKMASQAMKREISDGGLSGSGYEQYLMSEAKKAEDSALAAAESANAENKARMLSGYEKYISDYEKLQGKISNAVIEHFSAQESFSLEDAYKYAIGRGLSEDTAYYTAAAAVRAASEAAVKKIIAFADKNHLTAKQARRYARNSGLDERYVNQIYEATLSLSDEERFKYSTMGPIDYIKYIKTMKG